MINSIVRLSSLLLGVALLLTGHGLQLALVPMRAQINGWNSADVGYLSSMYFIGFIIGCFTIPRLVSRIGHIRAFAALTAVMTTAILALSLGDNMLFWFLLRLAAGFSIVGLYLVIESWLNSQVENEVRGSVLSAYTAIVLAGLAVGQLLLNAAPPEGERLFVIAGMLVVLAALPVCITRSRQPPEIPTASFSPMLVINTSRAATVGSFISGCVTGSFYGLAPVFGLEIDMSVAQISLMMALGVVGGAVMQLPLGKLSDRIDRRRVIFAAMLAGTAVAAAGVMLPAALIPGLMFMFGACAMPLYALSLAHASDFVENDGFLEVGTGLLMINALGSIVGPLITSQLMYRLGPSTYFASLCVWLLLGSVLVLIFIRTRDRQATNFHEFSPATSAAAQGALQMDPRLEEEEPEPVMEGEVISEDDTENSG
jgi:MFS family permease